jgi:hypothetical protein
MSIAQILLTATSAGGPPTLEGTYKYNGSNVTWFLTNATSSTYGAYTYPDGSSGSLHTLTGSEFLMSSDIGNNTVLNINLWFYPTANNVVIMGELGQPAENSYWHYSMLDIDSTNHLRGRLWELVGGVTSTGTVTLNAWNHAYLYYNSVTGYVGMSLNNETAVTTNTGTRHLPDSGHTYVGIGLIDDQNLSSNARYQGKFGDLVIDNTVTGSNYLTLLDRSKYFAPTATLKLDLDTANWYSNVWSDTSNLGNNALTTGITQIGDNGGVLEFNGTTSFANVPSLQNSRYTSVSLSAWIKPSVVTGTTNTIIAKELCYKLRTNSDGTLTFSTGSGSAPWVRLATVSAGVITANTWAHVVATSDATNTRIYVNGVMVAETAGTTIGNNNEAFNIGTFTNGAGNDFFGGRMGEVKVWNYALTDADVVTQYNTTATRYGRSALPLSLMFNQPQADYLSTPASADWNLGNNWTIEFWIRSNNNSANNINIPGGQWGLINQGGWYYGMPDDNCILVGMAGGYLTINQSATGDISFAEPTTQVWTHVAIVNNGGGSAQKVYYNGVEQTPTGANYTSNGKTNTTETLYIGRLEPPSYGGLFDGKMALVRISNTAKYLTAFTATTTYGVEADTKLFLGSDNPLVDSMSHTVTNNGVTTSASFPVTIIITNVSVGSSTFLATVDFTSTVSQAETATIFFEWFSGAIFSGPHTLTVNPGVNTYTSPVLGLYGDGNDLTTEITIASGVNACTSNIYTGSWSVICLVEGTMVTMADGSYKAIEDIRYNDLLRVWNFDLGEFSEALPVFVKQEETHAEHYRFTFSDGTVLRTVGHHVFNKQAGAFTMLVRDTTPVGTITFNEFGEEVTLIAKETIEEPVRFYNVWTQYHLNLFAQGILTSNRFNNIYPIQDMKFVKDNRALRPLEEFANIDPKYISGLRLQEQPAQYTAEYIRDYVESKLERLDVANIITYVHTE